MRPPRSNSVQDLTEPPKWWTVRAAQSLKPATYRCPFCDELLPAMVEHVLVAPEGDTRRRRHAHTACALAERKAGRLPLRDEVLPRRRRFWTRSR